MKSRMKLLEIGVVFVVILVIGITFQSNSIATLKTQTTLSMTTLSIK
jgi:hypothetical protein